MGAVWGLGKLKLSLSQNHEKVFLKNKVNEKSKCVGASCNERQRVYIHSQTAEAHCWWNTRVRTHRLLVLGPLGPSRI